MTTKHASQTIEDLARLSENPEQTPRVRLYGIPVEIDSPERALAVLEALAVCIKDLESDLHLLLRGTTS